MIIEYQDIPSRSQYFCPKHKEFFAYGDSCPGCDPSAKKVVFKHKKVVKTRGVVVNLRQKGCKQKEIAKLVGISQQRVSKILRGLSGNIPVRERFHNFSLRFVANVPYDSIELPESSFGNTHFKRFKNDDFFVMIFRGSVLVRYLKDIVGLKIVDSEEHAIDGIMAFLREWNVYHIVFLKAVVSSGHNAFVDSVIARDVSSKGEKLIYRDRVDGKARSLIDASKGRVEFEHVHKDHYKGDSEKWEELTDDVATGNYYRFSESKYLLDGLLKTQVIFGENLKSHVKAVQDLSAGVQDLSAGSVANAESVRKLSSAVSLLTRVVKKLRK